MDTKYLKFNLNDYVFVKLKDEGFKHLVEFYSSVPFPASMAYILDEAYYRDKVDAEGYYRFQLHEFMETFGSVWSQKYPKMFDMDVRFESSDMTPVEECVVTFVDRFCEGDV